MKAIILDYTCSLVLVIPIPKEWEENPSEFVEGLPCYCNQCFHMIVCSDSIEVYNIVKDGEDSDGHPCYDYQRATTL